ncbi:uridine phosphorylase [Oceanispirochaeta crateris]|uniref:Uridine phosphorylase n=1 Tax=Oceanispirochaeta crateris TaxID=2518645 RepID=A0A5C1QNV7_9SPIO|nr:uridine phosphorylase [Oceanispirochaeta crateris]
MKKKLTEDKVFYHVKLSKAMLSGALTAVLPGDPGRVEKTARMIDPDAVFLVSNREYTSWLADLSGHKVLVCSTGIGGPSVSICMEELAALGITSFYRIGTTGAIQDHIKIGDLIITTGSVRLDGASTHYAPIEYPAVADFDLTLSLLQAASNLDIPHHKGISASSDTFYPGQERYDTFTSYVPMRFQGSLNEWKQLNVLNYEMESSTLLTIASVFGVKAAMVASVIALRGKQETPDDKILPLAEKRLADCIREALSLHLTGDSYS